MEQPEHQLVAAKLHEHSLKFCRGHNKGKMFKDSGGTADSIGTAEKIKEKGIRLA